MKDHPSILFYLKKATFDKKGKSRIYARITVKGQRAEFSIHRKVSVSLWNASSSKAMGNTPEAYALNSHMTKIKNDIFLCYQQMKQKKVVVTARSLKECYLGTDEKAKMLLQIFQDHNDKLEGLVGREYSPGTAERYRTARKHVQAYTKKEYHKSDIEVTEVDHKFITGFEYYLKTHRKCSHNTAIKYITNFKKIIRIALAHDWIKKDPFLNWKAQLKIVDREFLTSHELQILLATEIKVPRLDQVKDIFLFSCYTGLAYADVKKLSENDLVIGIDGGKWIKTKRSKTDTRSSIPILPTADLILEKYKKHPDVENSPRMLPVLTNQKMNAYLKEIADLSGIKKNLTFHLARHTFATTVTLSNGVPIESVSKMLGHKSLRTTQHYAKILDQKVSEDMQALQKRLRLKIDSSYRIK